MSWESVVSLCISPSPSLVTRLQACRSFILSSPQRQMFGMLEIWSSLCVVQSSAICPRISMMLLIWIFQAHYPSILFCMCVIRSELMSLMGQLAVDSHVEQKIVEVHDQFFACIALEDSLFSLQFPTIYSTISNPNSTPQLVYSLFLDSWNRLKRKWDKTSPRRCSVWSSVSAVSLPFELLQMVLPPSLLKSLRIESKRKLYVVVVEEGDWW